MSGGTVVRRALPDDRAVLLALNDELQEFERALRPSRSPGNAIAAKNLDRTERELVRKPKDGALFVAEQAGEVVGFVTCFLGEDFFEAVREEVQIRDLVVTASARQSGAGRALLDAVRQFARERDVQRVTVGVLQANAVAMAAYARLGFQPMYVFLEMPA
jgi:GNAT superfamily N-acetyltransferase